MEMKKKEYEDLFNNPWCPLFGELPYFPELHPSSQIERCINTIETARSIWKISLNPVDDYFLGTSWPSADEVHPYSEKLLESARTIFRAYLSVLTYATDDKTDIDFGLENAISVIRKQGPYPMTH